MGVFSGLIGHLSLWCVSFATSQPRFKSFGGVDIRFYCEHGLGSLRQYEETVGEIQYFQVCCIGRTVRGGGFVLARA